MLCHERLLPKSYAFLLSTIEKNEDEAMKFVNTGQLFAPITSPVFPIGPPNVFYIYERKFGVRTIIRGETEDVEMSRKIVNYLTP